MPETAFKSSLNPNPYKSRWPAARAMAWYKSKGWVMGFNFVPSTSCNTTEMWQASTFDLATIRRELTLARETGFNSVRVFIQYLVWKDDPAGLKSRFEQFLALAAENKLSVVPVLFDDCAFGEPLQLDPFLGAQREPIPGVVLSSWTPCPGDAIGNDPRQAADLKAYVQDLITTHASDSRILFWDLFNEPLNKAHVGTIPFLESVFSWAREINPSQPLTVCVYGKLDEAIFAMSDVVSFHVYAATPQMEKEIAQIQSFVINAGYPLICTEWMARPLGGDYRTGLPLFKSLNLWCYQWGLVSGRTQGKFPWWNAPGGDVDPTYGWFHDIFHPDGTPYRPEEIAIIRAHAPQ